jgi:hypothetical protein
VARVSGTQQAVDHAGRDNELAYQEMLKGLELKRDMETVSSASTRPRDRRHHDRPSDGLDPVLDQDQHQGRARPALTRHLGHQLPHGRHPDCVHRSAAEDRSFGDLDCRAAAPNVIFTGAFNKQQFSTFTGRASPIEETKAKKITARSRPTSPTSAFSRSRPTASSGPATCSCSKWASGLWPSSTAAT